MTEANGRPSLWSRKSLVDAGFKHPAAVEVVEEPVDKARGLGLLARIEARNRRKKACELRPTPRQLRSDRLSLRQMGAIAAVGALANGVDRNALRRISVRSVHQPREVEIVRDHGE